jgi:hypothetical protein
MKLLSSFIFIHLKMFLWAFSGAAALGFIASTVTKMQNADIPLTVLLPFSQFFK